MRKKTPKVKHFFHGRIQFNSVQNAITIVFSVVSLISMLILTLVLYANFYRQNSDSLEQSTQLIMEQIGQNLESFLGSSRRVADTAYFDAIQEAAISDQSLSDRLGLLCEVGRGKVQSIALFSTDGTLLSASPVMNQKANVDVTSQEWFQDAVSEIENIHVSLPHVQNLFENDEDGYQWVISMSRMVEMNEGDDSRQGVLLIDLDYDVLTSIMEQINERDNGQYFYLCDSSGHIIYHPEMMFLQRNILDENNKNDAAQEDGIHEEEFQGSSRTIIVQTIAYTGWKLIGVIPESSRQYGMASLTWSILSILLIAAMIILALNRIISNRISDPLRRLNKSVTDYEAGMRPEIYCGGTEEIQHLGRSIQKSYEQIEELIQQIIREQNERRKSETDALQGQIHPHFLYNTLDSITWMIEGGKEEDAVQMISDLAKLLRISLSKGKTIISIKDEMQHALSYMAIQKVRYKDRFISEFDIDPEVEKYCTVKLIVQPVLENAVYYGVGDMDPDDGGKISVTGRIEDGTVVFRVTDNGAGMPEETVKDLLDDSKQVHKNGNGVGLVNVHRRIQLIFGEAYGLEIQSEPDMGTSVTIRFPAVLFTKENQKKLEDGTMRETFGGAKNARRE